MNNHVRVWGRTLCTCVWIKKGRGGGGHFRCFNGRTDFLCNNMKMTRRSRRLRDDDRRRCLLDESPWSWLRITHSHTHQKNQVWKHRWKWGRGGWVGWRGDVERTWHEARISWELDGRGAVPKLDRRPASVCVYVRACVCMSGVHPYTKHLAHTEGKKEQKTLRQTLNTK